MTGRVNVLKELVGDGLYVIDDAAVAEALLVRCSARRLLPAVAFPGGPSPAPQVRSFRPHRAVRSFRLTRGERRSLRRARGALRAAA